VTRPVRVFVVIVNYRTGRMAVEALRSLEVERDAVSELRVAVVDNASGDDSVAVLHEAIRAYGWHDWVRVIESERNLGFGRGNNLALRPELAADPAPHYFLLLNPDAELYPGALGAMVDFLEVRQEAGIAGPCTEIGRGNVRGTAFRFPGIASEFCRASHLAVMDRLFHRWILAPEARPEAHETDWLSGGCMLISRRVFEETGAFDDGFFLYFEETDLCRRARAQGWQSWFVPSARIVHFAGASTGVTGEGSLEQPVPDYWFHSRNHYFAKHHSRIYKLAVDLAWLAGHLLSRCLRAIRGRPPAEPPGFLKSFVRHNLVPRSFRPKPTEPAAP